MAEDVADDTATFLRGRGGVSAAAAAAMGLPDDVWAGRWVEAGPSGTLLRHAAQPSLTEHGRPVYFVLVACRRRRYYSIIDGRTEFKLGQSIYNDEDGGFLVWADAAAALTESYGSAARLRDAPKALLRVLAAGSTSADRRVPCIGYYGRRYPLITPVALVAQGGQLQRLYRALRCDLELPRPPALATALAAHTSGALHPAATSDGPGRAHGPRCLHPSAPRCSNCSASWTARRLPLRPAARARTGRIVLGHASRDPSLDRATMRALTPSSGAPIATLPHGYFLPRAADQLPPELQQPRWSGDAPARTSYNGALAGNPSILVVGSGGVSSVFVQSEPKPSGRRISASVASVFAHEPTAPEVDLHMLARAGRVSHAVSQVLSPARARLRGTGPVNNKQPYSVPLVGS